MLIRFLYYEEAASAKDKNASQRHHITKHPLSISLVKYQ